MKIPKFKTPQEGVLAIESYLRQVLSSVPYAELPIKRPQVKDFDPKKLHFSDIASECPRKAILSATINNNEFKGNGYTLAGEHLETLVVGALEYGHPDEFDLQGSLSNIPEETQAHMDAVWNCRNVIFEIKSIGIAARQVKDYPLIPHQIQLGMYVAKKEQETGEKWTGFLIYIFRENPMEVDVFFLPEHFKNEALLRLEESVKNFKAKKIPPIPGYFEPDHFPCKWTTRTGASFCPHYKHCWEHYEKDETPLAPLTNREKQKKANALEEALAQKDALKDQIKELDEKIDTWEKELKGEFLKSDEGKIWTDGETDLKHIVRPARVDHDLKQLMRKGLIPQNLLDMVKKNVPASEHIRRVKKKKVAE